MKYRAIAVGLSLCNAAVVFGQTSQPTRQPAAQDLVDRYEALVATTESGTADAPFIEAPGPVISIGAGYLQAQRAMRQKIGAILEQADRQEAKDREEIEVADETAKELRQRLQSFARPDITEDSVAARVDEWQKQLDALTFDRVSAEARELAIKDAISSLSQKAEAAAVSDPVASQLQQVVDARKQQVDALEKEHASGVASTADLTSARAEEADASAKLAERKEQAMANAGGSEIASLQHELIELVIARQERDAKIGFVTDRLDKTQQALAMADGIAQNQARRAAAEADIAQYENELNPARQSYANLSEHPDGPTTAP